MVRRHARVSPSMNALKRRARRSSRSIGRGAKLGELLDAIGLDVGRGGRSPPARTGRRRRRNPRVLSPTSGKRSLTPIEVRTSTSRFLNPASGERSVRFINVYMMHSWAQDVAQRPKPPGLLFSWQNNVRAVASVEQAGKPYRWVRRWPSVVPRFGLRPATVPASRATPAHPNRRERDEYYQRPQAEPGPAAAAGTGGCCCLIHACPSRGVIGRSCNSAGIPAAALSVRR